MKLLRQRNFAVLFSGQMLSTIGNNLFTIALLWYVLERTGSRLDVSLAGIAQTVPGLLALFTGVFVDRWRKRPIMMTSDLVRAGLAFALLWLVQAGPFYLPVILLLVLLLEFAGTFFRPAANAFLPQIVPQEDLPAAAGMFQSSSAGAQFLGIAGGGALVGWIGVPAVFALNALSFLASVTGVGLVRVREEPVHAAGPQVSFRKEWGEGLRAIVRSRLLLRTIGAALLVNFALAPLDVLFPVWVRGTLHGQAGALGLLMGALLLGTLAGGLATGAVAARFDLRSVLLGTFLATGAALAALGMVPSLPFDMADGFVLGAAAGIASGMLTSLLLQKVPAQARGRIFGTLGALSTAAAPAGIALAGALTAIALPVLFAGFGLLVLAVGASFLAPIPDDLAAIGA